MLNKNKSYDHQFNCLLTRNIVNRVGHCLHANSTKKLHKSAKIEPGYPKCIPDDRPVSVHQQDT